jgi:hypothetical protein
MKGNQMSTSQIYIALSIAALAMLAVLVLVINKRSQKKLTPLAGLAFGFVLAGSLFSEDRLIGYGLMGIGVLLAVIDIFRQRRKAI